MTKQLTTASKSELSLLMADVLRAVLTGGRYPLRLLSQVVTRVLVDREVNCTRVSMIKAVINRNKRLSGQEEELTVGLDKKCTRTPYLLGRLFAVLERIQKAHNSDLNKTIKDKYMPAAMRTPTKVMPQLLQLSQYHLSKLDKNKQQPYYERILGKIMDKIDWMEVPDALPLMQQGDMITGYYHQRQDFYKPKKKEESNETAAQ
jgi:CRISPR-associated protein Csd1